MGPSEVAIRPIERGDVAHLLTRLRVRDRIELDALGVSYDVALDVLSNGVVAGALFTWNGAPAAVLTFHRVGERTVEASMLSTDDWPHVSRAVIRWGLGFAKPQLLAMGFDVAQVLVMDGYREAIRLIEFAGFHRGETVVMTTGRRFIRYVWRINVNSPGATLRS